MKKLFKLNAKVTFGLKESFRFCRSNFCFYAFKPVWV